MPCFNQRCTAKVPSSSPATPLSPQIDDQCELKAIEREKSVTALPPREACKCSKGDLARAFHVRTVFVSVFISFLIVLTKYVSQKLLGGGGVLSGFWFKVSSGLARKSCDRRQLVSSICIQAAERADAGAWLGPHTLMPWCHPHSGQTAKGSLEMPAETHPEVCSWGF